MRRGGLDYKKVYAAYRAATETEGAPTVILAKTIKGWLLGPGIQGGNTTHQVKKLTADQLIALRRRTSHLQDEISDEVAVLRRARPTTGRRSTRPRCSTSASGARRSTDLSRAGSSTSAGR